MKTLRLKINKPLKYLKPGMTIDIPCDKDNIPLERYWRQRLKDSAIDDCVSVEKKTVAKKEK